MKRILLFAALLSCLLTGCKKNKGLSMTGVYKLDKQWISGGGSDSVYQKTQIKIYTAHQFIYAGITPDSAVSFGVGNYKPDTGNRIVENEFYSSYRLDTTRDFKVDMTLTDKGFTQKIPAIATLKGVKYDLMEAYSKETSGDSSKLDGLWKMSKSYMVSGKDTTKKEVTQYKIFQGGHFLFAGRYLVDKTANKFKNNFGYGSFNMTGGDLVEENTISSDATALTHKFSIKIAFNGNDAYTQVIADAKTNQQSIESYVRIK
ncbi:MAG TPA: hypothetical protein VFE53_14890 [Mucilaginibacter sp.]|nr:hypothetical protein [Mucilaginibacter sp.]